MGFFAVEYAVLRTTNRILSPVEVQKRWEKTMSQIVKHLEKHFFEPTDVEAMGMVNVSMPSDGSEFPDADFSVGSESLLQMKHIIASFCFSMNNQLGFYVTPMWSLLESYRIRFAQLLMQKCKHKVTKLLRDDSMIGHQYEVRTMEEWNKLKRYGLLEREVMSKRRRPQLPQTMNFLPLVIALCELVVHDLMDPFFAFARNLFSFDLSSPAMLDKHRDAAQSSTIPDSDVDDDDDDDEREYTELRFLVDHLLRFIADQFERQMTSAPSNSMSQYSQTSVSARYMGRLCEVS